MATKANSKPCQACEMEPFPRSRYWLYRRTQNLATSKMELYAFCAKASILDVWQGCEYVSELASKVKGVSF